ncbi:hypothetical protein MLP_38720 [Microlunatus phosphovorus NM-1]|uniref:DUF3618 domain-containing protein n=1 Tax=Microlunatus phosphovorus (strain ATCC 700054 / DSM 10555 / JCM 9379 / NBRC 101784 / NCIMB 13414 / VKM Ac-1990 / NM-1) TaxID=1032480 RepID=F5XQ55_MICPN|nr:DUF3618 domain-containing protein [Microlunatus phosphovorus]BAK36886.1 hypothetical protein MLP_38720 [Microlunatus phosphovorus NM-1]
MAANESTHPTRTPEQIEADLAAARLRIAHSTEEFIDQVHPSRIKQRQIDNVKQFVGNEVDAAKTLVYNAKGDLRKERLIAIAGAVVGGLVFLAVIRGLVRRGRS